ncbi:MAG: signal peptidase I [Candidatus Paceibacterota bacterium]
MEEQLSTNPQNDTPKQKKQSGFFMEIVKFTTIAVIIVVPFRLFIAQPFVVNGASMDPTFDTGEYLIVDQVTYKFEAPERGSVVIFKYPKDTTKFFIKRIIGLPGETVEISGTKVKIKNNEHPDGIILDEPYVAINHEKQDSMTVTLKNNEYFVMGDNRSGSSDSRMWGPVNENLITGRPFVRLLPLQKIGLFPGNAQAQN